MKVFNSWSGDVLGICFVSILGAAIWPFIYPILDLVLAFIGFASSPGPFKALQEFGPLYGKLSETAPGFFKGMAEATQQLSGEHPALASLPYMAKAKLLAYSTVPFYAVEVLAFVLVVVISLLSRILPLKLARNGMQGIAILLAMLPLVAVSLWCIAFFLLAFIQAWQIGFLYFVFLVLIWPVVAIKVVSSNVGLFWLAYGLVPAGLAFAGRGSLAGGFIRAFFSTYI